MNTLLQYEGDNSVFVWKHPTENFEDGTQLVVHESQEAIFFLNGEALDLFGAGRYTLSADCLPKLNSKTPEGKPYHAEVYFVNKTEQMGVKWGTDSKVQYLEPVYGFPVSLGACGEMSLRVDNSRKLLVKLVGTETELTQAKLMQYFKGILVTHLKVTLAQTIKAQSINIFEIDVKLLDLSAELLRQLKPVFEDYGVALERFLITTVLKPDGDPQYEKFKELNYRKHTDIAEAQLRQQVGVIDANTEAQKTIILSQANAKKRETEGYTYQQEREFDVQQSAASESVGKTLCRNCGNYVTKGKFCPECGAPLIETCSKCGTEVKNAKFCPNCGTKL